MYGYCIRAPVPAKYTNMQVAGSDCNGDLKINSCAPQSGTLGKEHCVNLRWNWLRNWPLILAGILMVFLCYVITSWRDDQLTDHRKSLSPTIIANYMSVIFYVFLLYDIF